jgi:phosphoesterase RecJ-like protein
MDTSLFLPITNLIEKSQNILVLCHAKPDPDALGASLSFCLAMKELGKQATVVTNEPAKESMAFLPAMNTLQYTLGGTKDFIISLDTTKKSISKIKYNAEEGRVNIIITPKDGIFMASDVAFRAGKNQYDLIVAFDTGNVEYFGKLYENNIQLFFDTPIINIDHHASNTDYGQLNLVVPTAASTTEILYDYLLFLEKKNAKKLISPDVATLLLAGLITDTGSFQHANTSPRSLEVAAELLDLGGRQQEIIKHFFKTKKLSTLKLWGMILSKVQVDPLHRMVWSSISLEDFLSSEAEPEETEGIIDDLLTNAPGAEVIFLIKQNKDYVSVSTRSTANGIDVGKLCAENGGGGHPRAAGFRVPGNRSFEEVVAEVVKKVREFQAKRLNIQPEDLKLEIRNSKFEAQGSKTEPPSAKSTVAPATESSAPKVAEPGYNPAPGVKAETKATEKKVTYLDFPAKQEVKPIVAPVAPAPLQAPKVETKPAETPMPKAAEPLAKKVDVTEQKEIPASPSALLGAGAGMTGGAETKNGAKSLAQNPVATMADPKPIDPNAPAKKHRKRHHKKKIAGDVAAGKPVNPPV